MAWYRTGTITVTNGSTTVTGSGTQWIANVGIGEGFLAPDGKIYEISDIVSNTSLRIASQYLGSTQSGQAYVIVPTQSYIRDLAAAAAALVESYDMSTWGQGFTKSANAAVARTSLELGTAAASSVVQTTGSDTSNVMSQDAVTKSFDIFVRDSLRQSVEMSSGGRQTVLYTAKGQPSHMYISSAYNREDLNIGSGTGLMPAYIVNGQSISEFFVGVYPGIVSQGEFISLPGVIPSGSQTIDSFTSTVRANGSGWHLMTNAEWMAIALWCWKNGFLPRGNNQWGRDVTNKWETGVRTDGYTPGDDAGDGFTLTGSGPASWRHDGTSAGIADLNGNKGEWTPGIRLVEGEIQIIPNNDAALPGADLGSSSGLWRAIRASDGELVMPGIAGTIKFDASTSSGGAPILSDVITNHLGAIGDNSNSGNSASTPLMDLSANVSVPDEAILAGMYKPGGGLDGSRIYMRNFGERVAYRGGRRSGTSHAGVFTAYFSHSRSYSATHLGARPAFVNL